jgi:hypothetical protein
VLVCAGLTAGCGAAQTDSGGFTVSQFTDAQKALAALAQTSVYDTALDITQTAAEDPTACEVHIQATNPVSFSVFMSWIPNQANLGGGVLQQAAARTFSWIRATIGPQGLRGNYSFHEGNALTLRGLQAQYGDAFSKPVERCLLLQNDAFGLLPSPTK